MQRTSWVDGAKVVLANLNQAGAAAASARLGDADSAIGVGMDITDPGFWDAGLKIVDGMVTEVERLAAEQR